jgi:hypothetical protein
VVTTELSNANMLSHEEGIKCDGEGCANHVTVLSTSYEGLIGYGIPKQLMEQSPS